MCNFIEDEQVNETAEERELNNLMTKEKEVFDCESCFDLDRESNVPNDVSNLRLGLLEQDDSHEGCLTDDADESIEDSSHDAPEVDTASGYIPQKAYKIGGDKPPSDQEILKSYESRILRELRSSKRNLARVGVLLCDAKKSLGKGTSLSPSQEKTFTRWYEDALGISQDKARRLMRWVRPVLDVVDWDDDDDPILNELASVGPCLFDEVMKLPEDYWYVTEFGELFLAAAATGTVDIPAKELSVRKVREMRDILNALVDVAANSRNKTVNTSGVDGDTDPDGENAASPVQDSPVDSCMNLIKESADKSATSDEDNPYPDNSGNIDNTETSVNISVPTVIAQSSQAMSSAAKAVAAKTGVTDILNKEDWSYCDFTLSTLPVIQGKTRNGDTTAERIISGINVMFYLDGDDMIHKVIDSKQDAFYAVMMDSMITMYWYDRTRMLWHEAQMTPAECVINVDDDHGRDGWTESNGSICEEDVVAI